MIDVISQLCTRQKSKVVFIMSSEVEVSEHYTQGALLSKIEASLAAMGKSISNVTEEDLSPIGEFHIGGRIATDNLLKQLSFTDHDHILDVGCGTGGAARYIAKNLKSQVTGIDLTQEYIEVGNTLSRWVGLDNHVQLHQGSALSMPFNNDSFDGAIMLHVGMNIADKATLFKEVYRVLKPGSHFAIYDVMQIDDGNLSFPVPWSEDGSTSYLATPEQYLNTLEETHFITCQHTMRRYFALDFFNTMQEQLQEEGLPPLGLHTLISESVETKIHNMVNNIKAGFISPVEIIAHKPA